MLSQSIGTMGYAIVLIVIIMCMLVGIYRIFKDFFSPHTKKDFSRITATIIALCLPFGFIYLCVVDLLRIIAE